jgi:hypothetical protein
MTGVRPYSENVWLLIMLTLVIWWLPFAWTVQARAEIEEELHIEVTKKGIGKQVVISQGAQEWFMLVEVTPENSVILKQERDHDRYLVDESETHDRPMTADEVEAAIRDYINSVKTRVQKK